MNVFLCFFIIKVAHIISVQRQHPNSNSLLLCSHTSSRLCLCCLLFAICRLIFFFLRFFRFKYYHWQSFNRRRLLLYFHYTQHGKQTTFVRYFFLLTLNIKRFCFAYIVICLWIYFSLFVVCVLDFFSSYFYFWL